MDSDDARNGVQLTTLFNTPLLLAYAIPLLLLSLFLAFSGTFFTLDRTRMFVPRSDAVEPIPGAFEKDIQKKRFKWILEGGIGGLVSGFLFGLHATTLLALVIMNNTSSSPLSPVSFLVTWVLSSIFTTLLAGRWKYIALGFIGSLGGITLSTALSIVLHPALLSRQILIAIFLPLTLIAALLPFPISQHLAVRTCTSAAGSFGVVVSIALLAHIPSWANSWERLWIPKSIQWGTNEERVLDAAFCLIWVVGAACDWFLHKQFGENPDRKWDSFLADYAAGLHNAHDRTGNFQPLQSWWSKLFKSRKTSDPILFPSDEMLKTSTPGGSQIDESQMHALLYAYNSDPKKPTLKKPRADSLQNSTDGHGHGFIVDQGTPKRLDKSLKRKKHDKSSRPPVRFQPIGGFSSSSEDDSDDDNDFSVLKTPGDTPGSERNMRPWVMDRMSSSRTSLSGSTAVGHSELVNNPKNIGQLKEKDGVTMMKPVNGPPEYSDVDEDDVTNVVRRVSSGHRDQPGWKPDFIKRHTNSRFNQTTTSPENDTNKLAPSSSPPTAPAGAVPVTPSLINALDRIAAAQREAYSVPRVTEAGGSIRSVEHSREATHAAASNPGVTPVVGHRWENFWRDVRHKAVVDNSASNEPMAV